MNKLHYDFETFSVINLKTQKVYRYAMDPSTDILCVAVKWNDGPVRIWSPLFSCDEIEAMGLNPISLEELCELMDLADIIVAHNAMFERLIIKYVGTRYGMPEQPISKFRCTAALASSLALPRALGMLARALSCRMQKDEEGGKVMLKYCKPTKKGERLDLRNNLDDARKLFAYCRTDVLCEEEIEEILPPLTEAEQEVWELDQAINDRGIRIDIDGVKYLLDLVAAEEKKLLAEVATITEGKVHSPRQIDASIEWLRSEGFELDNMKKSSVKEALGDFNSAMSGENGKRFLEIRQSLGKASVKKLSAILGMTCADGRARGTTLYHSAAPGRWGGVGIQPHNLPRDSFKEEDVELMLLGLLDGCPIINASKCLRGLLLIAGAIDFSAIQGRIVAWLAGEEHVLKAYREGKDLYKVAASAIFDILYTAVDKAQRQIGKVAELALNFQGWIGAFFTMAEAMPDVVATIDSWGKIIKEGEPGYEEWLQERGWDLPPKKITEQDARDERTAQIVRKWRAAHPATVALWKGLNDAAVETVEIGLPVRYGKIIFGMGEFKLPTGPVPVLYMMLPGGRKLCYPFARIEEVTTKYGQKKKAVTFMGMDNGKWVRMSTYGGKLLENAAMGIERDFLVHSMQTMEALGQEIVLHVHDEACPEPSPGIELDQLEAMMRHLPWWAKDFPMAVAGWVGKRYRKD